MHPVQGLGVVDPVVPSLRLVFVVLCDSVKVTLAFVDMAGVRESDSHGLGAVLVSWTPHGVMTDGRNTVVSSLLRCCLCLSIRPRFGPDSGCVCDVPDGVVAVL